MNTQMQNNKLLHARMITSSYWLGIITSASVFSLIQDWFGPDRYVQHIRNGWVDERISVPVAITILTGALIGLRNLRSNAYAIGDNDEM